ncbi:class I SAM-dependent methyltransferase [Halostreptopolyspora alba]|uniref:Class I SAM-dependent methyltransferase n=1 Tax=Halostreptopolyspora alba TaxID=2487137 RepID=A0A3N0E6P5_9ACTN|nr:class I SAM-dependent methyltransferase [Nocardiopsaceae bacterium YIM 96095]
MAPDEAHEEASSATGAAAYGPLVLAGYDTYVLRFSLRFLWGCPKREILDVYERNAGPEHLDIGVGTGFFLERAGAITPDTRLELLDLNPVPLRTVERRLSGYRMRTHVGDAAEEIPLADASLDSVGMANLLHCMPGDFTRKARAFDQARRVLRPGGRIFGSTVVGGGSGVRVNPLARRVMRTYRARGGFDNIDDTPEKLTAELEARFTDVRVTVRGCVALFEGTA